MSLMLKACRAAVLLVCALSPACSQAEPAAPDLSGAASITVAPREAVIAPGDSLRLVPTAYDRDGFVVPDVLVSWSSSDRRVASVAADGTVGGLAPGSVVITATVGERRATAAIQVAEAPDFGAVIRGVRPRGFGQGAYSLIRPATGGRVYWVAPAGSDGNPGTSALPLRTIARAAQLALAGDVVTIRPGTYEESVLVQNSGTEDRRIVFQAEQRGQTLLTGGSYTFGPAHWTGSMTATGQFFVTVRGLIFRAYGVPPEPGCTTCAYAPAVEAARGWRIEDCWFDRSGEPGLDIRGSSVEVLRSTFSDHWIQAITAAGLSGGATSPSDPALTPLDGVRVEDVILRGNHRRTSQPGSPTASFVAKFLNTRGAVLENIESYDNNGVGFWFDARNTDYAVRHSYFHDNRSQTGSTTDGGGRGLVLEINWPGGLVENNVFAGNWGPAIDIANSSGITIVNNLFNSNNSAVRFTEWDRGSNPDGSPVYPLQDISITHNQIRDWNNSLGAIYSYASEGGFRLPSTQRILLDWDTYQGVRQTAPLAWWWNTASGSTIGPMKTIADMQSKAGWESHGRVGTVAVPLIHGGVTVESVH